MPLSMMQQLAIRDGNGRVRCPHCGRFRVEGDFPDQDGHVRIGKPGGEIDGLLHVPPACLACIEAEVPGGK